jgi:hypothetical protein
MTMEPLIRTTAIIDYCLGPLNLDPASPETIEARRRLEHAIKTFQMKAAKPVAVDFSTMRSQVINEAAFGCE